MDINLTIETSTTSVGLVLIDPGFVEIICEKLRSFTKKQYFCKYNGMAGFRGTRLLIEGL